MRANGKTETDSHNHMRLYAVCRFYCAHRFPTSNKTYTQHSHTTHISHVNDNKWRSLHMINCHFIVSFISISFPLSLSFCPSLAAVSHEHSARNDYQSPMNKWKNKKTQMKKNGFKSRTMQNMRTSWKELWSAHVRVTTRTHMRRCRDDEETDRTKWCESNTLTANFARSRTSTVQSVCAYVCHIHVTILSDTLRAVCQIVILFDVRSLFVCMCVLLNGFRWFGFSFGCEFRLLLCNGSRAAICWRQMLAEAAHIEQNCQPSAKCVLLYTYTVHVSMRTFSYHIRCRVVSPAMHVFCQKCHTQFISTFLPSPRTAPHTHILSDISISGCRRSAVVMMHRNRKTIKNSLRKLQNCKRLKSLLWRRSACTRRAEKVIRLQKEEKKKH